MQKKPLAPLLAFGGLLVIALPVAFAFVASDLAFGGSVSSALFVLTFTALALAALWALQLLWELWRDSRRDRQR